MFDTIKRTVATLVVVFSPMILFLVGKYLMGVDFSNESKQLILVIQGALLVSSGVVFYLNKR